MFAYLVYVLVNYLVIFRCDHLLSIWHYTHSRHTFNWIRMNLNFWLKSKKKNSESKHQSNLLCLRSPCVMAMCLNFVNWLKFMKSWITHYVANAFAHTHTILHPQRMTGAKTKTEEVKKKQFLTYKNTLLSTRWEKCIINFQRNATARLASYTHNVVASTVTSRDRGRATQLCPQFYEYFHFDCLECACVGALSCLYVFRLCQKFCVY